MSEPSTPEKAPTKKSLNRRMASGAAWTTGAFALQSVLRLGSNLILTRLLAPEAFGLIATVLMVQFLLEMLCDVGIRSSVIRSEHGDDPDYISSAWVMQFGRGLLIATLISIGAGIIALVASAGGFPEDSVYADPRTPYFILFGALASVIQGAISINIILAERHMAFAKVTMVRVGAQLLASTANITIAALTGNPIALAIGLVVNPLVMCIASYLVFDGPRFSVKITRAFAMDLLHFGKWILLASFLTFVAERGAQMMFGGYLDKVEFGFLAIALILINIARTGLKTVQRRVALPAFSELRRENPAEQTRGYYRMRLIADSAAIIGFLGALFLSAPIIGILYPPDYERVAMYVQLLSISILFVPIELVDAVLLSDGASKQYSIVKLSIALAVVTLIPLAYNQFGVEGAVLTAGIVPIAALPVTLVFGRKTIDFIWWREAILPTIAAGGFAYLLLR